jgi:non-ribosomal peptide synthetase component F/acyl carrier protein
LDRETVEGLSALGRREGCTLFMVLLAGFQAVLTRWTGLEDIIVGSPIANRNRAEVEGLIGFFLNFLVMRADLSGRPTLVELLGRVRKMCLEAYEHQDVPFETLVMELKPGRDLRHSPIFQVMFVLQNGGLEEVSAGGVNFSPMEVDIGVAKYDLTLNMEERDGGCVGWLEYSTELFEEETVGRFAEELGRLMKEMVESPRSKVQSPQSGSHINIKHQTSKFKEDSISKLQSRSSEDQGNIEVGPRFEVQGGGDELESAETIEGNGGDRVEEGVKGIWEEVLRRKGIRLEDDLFDLGGHSLLITRIISRIRRVFGVEVPIYAFFATPTLGEIVEEVKNGTERRMQNVE